MTNTSPKRVVAAKTPEPVTPAQQHSLADRFPEVLRQLRFERRLSQEKLAERANLHRTYISLIERGMSVPTLTTLEQIGAALCIQTSEVIRRLEEYKDSTMHTG